MTNEDEIRKLKVALLERELARMQRERTFLDLEIKACEGEIRILIKEHAIKQARGVGFTAQTGIGIVQQPWFDALPDDSFLRLPQLVQTRGRQNTAALLPFSSSTLWRMVSDGRFPRPIKLSERITVWRVRDVRNWLLQSHLAN